MKRIMVVMLAMALMMSGCGYLSTPVKYITTDGVQIDTTDDGAYYMAIRDIEIGADTSFNNAIATPGITSEQVFALAINKAYRQRTQVKAPTSLLDDFLKAYPVLRDMTQIFTGGIGEQNRSDSSSRMSAGRDIYVESNGNRNNGQDYLFTNDGGDGSSFSPAIDNSFGFRSDTDASDSSTHPDSYSLF